MLRSDNLTRSITDDAEGSSLSHLLIAASKAAKPAPDGAGKGPGTGLLGIYPKSVDNRTDQDSKKTKENKRLEGRRRLYADLKNAALILRDAIPHKLHAVAKCRWTKIAGHVSLHLMGVGNGQQRAAFKGVKVCGNVWACPVCSARISQRRRGEMNTLLAWGREISVVPMMLTLTARHGREDRLADLLDGMKRAKQRLRQRQEWKRLPVVGTVTATEITHGARNGWHPHFHEIILVEADDEEAARAMLQPLARAWLVSLRAFGLEGAEAAFQVQGAAQAGDYVVKWGAAEEVTLGTTKEGREQKGVKGQSPRQLLRRAGEGEDQARDLWLEYFAATSGKRRRQLVWSRGLKSRCGLDEVADEDAAEEETATEDDEVGSWDGASWCRIRSKRVRLMEAAERGGSAAVRAVERGPDDDDINLLVESDEIADERQGIRSFGQSDGDGKSEDEETRHGLICNR